MKAEGAGNKDAASGRWARRHGTLVLSVLITLAIGGADWVVDPAVRLFPLYFLPVAAAAWNLGTYPGVATALLAVCVWEGANHFDGHARCSVWIEIWNASVQLTSLLAFSILLSLLREKFNRESSRARIDALTGIANGFGLQERAEVELARARASGLPVALAYIDLDGFKAVNDSFGHEVGNQVLERVARVLQRTCRQSDVCARVGGDEFVVLLPAIDAAVAETVLARIVESIRDAMKREGWAVTASAGCACFEEAPTSVTALLSRADALMYRSKREGKDRAVIEVVDRPKLILAS